MKYKIFEDLKLVYVEVNDILRFEDLMQHLDELSRDPRYTPPMLKLVNYQNLKKYELSAKESEVFSNRKAALSDRFMHEKCAFVVPSDLGFGMARHHQAFIDENKIQIKIFRDLAEAKKWLEIDIPNEELTIS